MKNKFQNMNQDFNKNNENSKKNKKDKVGEYVDFEELD